MHTFITDFRKIWDKISAKKDFFSFFYNWNGRQHSYIDVICWYIATEIQGGSKIGIPNFCWFNKTFFWVQTQKNVLLNQQKFGSPNKVLNIRSMEILFELTQKILLIFFFFQFQQKNFASTTKNMELQIKITKFS